MKGREPRRRVALAARSRLDGRWTDVLIRNISSRGMLLEVPTPIDRGAYLEICRGRHVIVARAVWSNGRQVGVRSQDRIDMEALIARPDAPVGLRPSGEPERRWQARVIAKPTRSILISALLQKAAIGISGLAAAITLASFAHQTLSTPLLSVRDALASAELSSVVRAAPSRAGRLMPTTHL